MKTCPACQSQYSDDTLQYCLQDGTPLTGGAVTETPTVVLGETETVAARQASGWQRSQVTRLAEPLPAKGSNTAVVIAATAVGMLVIFGVIAVVGWMVFRNYDQPGSSNNTSNSKNIPGGLVTNVATTTPRQTGLPSPVPTGATAPTPMPTVPDDYVDDAAAKSEVSERVSNWNSSLGSHDLNAYMANYADTVDYYSRRGISSSSVRADKARAFSLYSSMRMNVSNMSVTVGPSGETATATFDKEWSFSGRDTSSGKVRSELKFRKTGSRWLITGERDVKVYYTR